MVLYIYSNCFEWDNKKSQTNKQKHGISFFEVIEVWAKYHLTVLKGAKSIDGEVRSFTVGYVGNNLYTVIWTKRGQNIRLISARRSRDGEKKAFENKNI